MKSKSFEAYEDIGIGIINPRSIIKISGAAEYLEKFIISCIKSGIDIEGLSKEEIEKYLKDNDDSL